MTLWSDRPAQTAALIVAMAGALAALLVVPGQTVVTKHVNDLFIFLDGAHRIVSGQVPNRDFHTALGPLNYYLPAAGYLVSGSFGAAMPITMAIYLLGLVPAIAYILASRLAPALAVPFGAFLLLILAVPINLGDGLTVLSFGMFYNRVGWAALGALVVMVLPAREAQPRRALPDALAAAVLVLTMLYTKVTFGVVGFAFLGFMLLDRDGRRWSAIALAITLAIAVLVEAFWRSTAAHVADLMLAGKVSGLVWGGIGTFLPILLRNLPDYVLFGLAAGLALWRAPSLRALLFYGFCGASGLLLLTQNAHDWGIIILYGAMAVAAETLVRNGLETGLDRGGRLAAGAPLLLLAVILPTIVHCAGAVGLHAVLATRRSGEEFGLPRFKGLRLVDLWGGDYELAAKYLASLDDGARALESLGPEAAHIFVLDFVTPFSAGLGLEPPRGDVSWYHYGRTFDRDHFIPPEELLRDVRVVMEPKFPIGGQGLPEVYGAYVAKNFEMVRETEFWRLRQPSAGAVARAASRF